MLWEEKLLYISDSHFTIYIVYKDAGKMMLGLRRQITITKLFLRVNSEVDISSLMNVSS